MEFGPLAEEDSPKIVERREINRISTETDDREESMMPL